MDGMRMIRGFGRAAGLVLAMAASVAAAQPADDTRPDPSPTPKAAPGVARESQTEYRTDTVELALSRAGQEGSEIEYFVRMKAGDVLVYSWTAEGGAADGDFYSDFHGMTAEQPPLQVLSYREGGGTSAQGSLIAPFDGTHGWLFKNDSARPLKLKLTLAGFYEQRSLRETMGLEGPEFIPFGPPGWPDRYGPAKK